MGHPGALPTARVGEVLAGEVIPKVIQLDGLSDTFLSGKEVAGGESPPEASGHWSGHCRLLLWARYG